MKKILIADDHPIFRKGLKDILTERFSEIAFGEASNAAEILAHLRKQKWDILLLDINMPGRSGLEVLHDIKGQGVRALVISGHAEEELAVRCIRLGAWGYLTKDKANEEVIVAVERIYAGKKYITESLTEQLVMQFENPENKKPHELLSDREYEIFLHLASGKTVSEIAEELSLGTATVSTYRARIMQKTGMKTNAEMTFYAVKQGLV